jgi:hypothetical protein
MVGFISLAAVLIYFSGPRITHHGKSPDQTDAVNNARQVGIALFEFQTEYGKFPDASTIEVVKQQTSSDWDLGTKSSNDFFRQLLAVGISQGESIFHAKIAGARRPDNNFTQAEALQKGECGFTYLVGALESDSPSRPILIAPMIPGTDRFDPKPFEGKAVVLKLDNSVSSLPIDKDGHVIIDGRNMMDPHHLIWNGHAPVIAWPDL